MSNTENIKSGIVHGRDDDCRGDAGSRLCDRWSMGMGV